MYCRSKKRPSRTGWNHTDVMKHGGRWGMYKLPGVWLFVFTVTAYCFHWQILFDLVVQWQLWWRVSALVFPFTSIIRHTSKLAGWFLKGKSCYGCLDFRIEAWFSQKKPLSQFRACVLASLSLTLCCLPCVIAALSHPSSCLFFPNLWHGVKCWLESCSQSERKGP